HVRQRDIGDGHVEHLHQRGQHHRDGDGAAVQLPVDCRAGRWAHDAVADLPMLARTFTVTSTLMPARSGGSSACASMAMRTGMRCTTLTQLPVAFCGGSSDDTAPEAGLMLSTWPCQVRS